MKSVEDYTNFAQFLSPEDAARANQTFQKLTNGSLANLVLTGGFAVEIHHLLHGFLAERRPLNDIDFLVDSFVKIPTHLATHLIFRHVHPYDPPGWREVAFN